MIITSGKTRLSLMMDIIFAQLIIFAYYMNMLFRSIKGVNRPAATAIFILLIAAVDVIGFKLLSRGKGNTKKEILKAIIISVFTFGLDLFIKYRVELKTYIICSLTAAAVSAFLFAAYLYKIRVHGKKDKKKYTIEWLRKCSFYLAFIITLCMSIILTFYLVNKIAGNNVYSSDAPIYDPAEADTYLAEKNMDTLLLLQDNEWEKLSYQERLDVLGIIANIEAQKLGLSHGVTVGASDLKDECWGMYSEPSYTVDIDLELLEKGNSTALLAVLCHEMYHSYQYLTVEEYDKADEASKGLYLYRDASVYKYEFDNYGELLDNGLYSKLKCEFDARAYAKETVSDYFDLIEEHLANTDEK